MRIFSAQATPAVMTFQAALCLTLVTASISANAAEAYKLRQTPLGLFGGEMATHLDTPGLFGTAALSHIRINKIVDGNGNEIGVPGRNVPLPTGAPTAGAVPDGTYTLNVPAGTIDFSHTQTQVNLVGGYMTHDTFADGRFAFAVNVPLIRQSRSFNVTQAPGTVSPIPDATLPAPVRGAISAVATAANNQVQAGVAANAASQNADVSGVGDTELSMAWLRNVGRLKIAAGVSLFVPTGAYDKNRGPNPGFGDFYTLRPGVALTYALNPNQDDSGWDAGVTVGGRLSYGINSTNRETDYRSGNFVTAEAAVVKVKGDWALGANLLAIQQVTDDSGLNAPENGNRYRTYSVGPFLSYKIPGQDAGFNLHYSQNFGGRNAIVAQSLQLRFIKAW